MNHLELFAGIGGFRRAMDLLTLDGVMNFKCIGFSEIDAKAIRTYTANYDTNGEIPVGDIAAFTEDTQRIKDLPHFDLLTGGFPCQTFSMMGGKAGFESGRSDRGQMFYRIMDIVNERHPQYILLENVKNLVNHDKGNTIATILRELRSAGYYVHYDIFNTADFGLPQTRNRTLIFARLNNYGDFEFTCSLVKTYFDMIERNRCSLDFYDTTLDVLSTKVDSKYYLSERIKPTILSDGSANFHSNSEIDKVIARPLTASMHKMHRACQDNYFSDNYINSKGQDRPSTYLSKDELTNLNIRKLTPQEAFMLQGFPSEFAIKSLNAGMNDGALYKQAGNAVSVNTIYATLYYLISTGIITEQQ